MCINSDKIHQTTRIIILLIKKIGSKHNLSNTGTNDSHIQIDLKRCETQSTIMSHTIKQ